MCSKRYRSHTATPLNSELCFIARPRSLVEMLHSTRSAVRCQQFGRQFDVFGDVSGPRNCSFHRGPYFISMIWQEEEKKVSEYAKWMEKGEVSEYTKWMEKGTDVCMKCSSITWCCLAKLVWLDLLSCVPLLWQVEQPRMMREPRTRWAHMAYVLRFARKSYALRPHCQVCSGTVCVTRKVAPRKVVKEIKVRSSWAAKSSKTGLPNGSKSRWMDASSWTCETCHGLS